MVSISAALDAPLRIVEPVCVTEPPDVLIVTPAPRSSSLSVKVTVLSVTPPPTAAEKLIVPAVPACRVRACLPVPVPSMLPEKLILPPDAAPEVVSITVVVWAAPSITVAPVSLTAPPEVTIDRFAARSSSLSVSAIAPSATPVPIAPDKAMVPFAPAFTVRPAVPAVTSSMVPAKLIPLPPVSVSVELAPSVAAP